MKTTMLIKKLLKKLTEKYSKGESGNNEEKTKTRYMEAALRPPIPYQTILYLTNTRDKYHWVFPK